MALTGSFQELVWLQIGSKGSGEEGKSWKLIPFSILVQDVENIQAGHNPLNDVFCFVFF